MTKPERTYAAMGTIQRHALGGAAFLAWTIVICVSLSANMTFAITLGRTPFEQDVLAGAGVASDLLKALSPLALLYFVFHRRWWPSFAAGTLFAVTMSFSLIASLGFVSGERMSQFDRGLSEITKAKEQRAMADDIVAKNGWALDYAKVPSSVAAARLDAAKSDSRWLASNGCTKATSNAMELWCRDARQLPVALTASKAREEWDAKAEALREKAGSVERTEPDYQIAALSRATGVDQKTVMLALILLTVLLIESGSAFGLSIALGLWTGSAKETGGVGALVDRSFRVVTGRKAAPEAVVSIKPTSARITAPEIPTAPGVASGPFVQTPAAPAVRKPLLKPINWAVSVEEQRVA